MKQTKPPTTVSREIFALGSDARTCRVADPGLAARPGLLPDASRTLSGRPDSGPYRQAGQPSATLMSGKTQGRLIYRSCRSPSAGLGRVDQQVALPA